MDVLLVRPLQARPHEIVPDIGLGYLATALLRRGHTVRILDCAKERLGMEGFIRVLRERPPDLVGFKLFSTDIASGSRMMERIRQEFSRPPVIAIGGPHVSGLGGAALETLRSADFGIQGEAEIGLPLLAEAIESGSLPENPSIPGLLYRVADQQVRANPPFFVENLDELGMPSWHLMPPATYPKQSFGLFVRRFPTAPILTTRGCPFRCTYCAGFKVTGRKLRKRSVESVLEELALLKTDFGIRDFTIVDDNFTLDRSFAMSLCEALIARRLDLSWSCPNGVRLDTLDAELVATMEKAGCYSVSVGIESGSDRVLKYMRKHLTVAQIRERVHLLRSASRIKITGFFMLGFPGENRVDIEQTIALALSLPLDRAAFSIFSPLPGTEISQRMIQEGRIQPVEEVFQKADFDSVLDSGETLPSREVKSLQRKAVLSFYLRPRVFRGILKEIRSLDQVRIIARRLSYVFR